MVTYYLHYNDVTDRRATSVQTACGCSFLSFPRAGIGYEIEVFHMGKNNRNLDLVC